MEKSFKSSREHAIIGFNHGLPCYVKTMAIGPQSRQKPRPTASTFVCLSPSGHVFNIAWQAMIKTYNTPQLAIRQHLFRQGLDTKTATSHYHNKAEAKWSTNSRRHFQMDFRQWNCCILIQISLKHVSKGPINKKNSIGSDNALVLTRRQAII